MTILGVSQASIGFRSAGLDRAYVAAASNNPGCGFQPQLQCRNNDAFVARQATFSQTRFGIDHAQGNSPTRADYWIDLKPNDLAVDPKTGKVTLKPRLISQIAYKLARDPANLRENHRPGFVWVSFKEIPEDKHQDVVKSLLGQSSKAFGFNGNVKIDPPLITGHVEMTPHLEGDVNETPLFGIFYTNYSNSCPAVTDLKLLDPDTAPFTSSHNVRETFYMPYQLKGKPRETWLNYSMLIKARHPGFLLLNNNIENGMGHSGQIVTSPFDSTVSSKTNEPRSLLTVFSEIIKPPFYNWTEPLQQLSARPSTAKPSFLSWFYLDILFR